jgi:hypothetical protein
MPAHAKREYNGDLIEKIASFATDPYGFTLFAFPWGEENTQLEFEQGPRDWQKDALLEIGTRLRRGYEPGEALHPILMSTASGHGIGKSAFVSFLTDWSLSTKVNAKVVITANTEKQLQTKTWPEIAKWFGMAINADWFVIRGESILSTNPGSQLTWRADAVTWSKTNLAAFQGLHNKGSRITLIFDEASEIIDGVYDPAMGMLVDKDTEIIWQLFGNPTKTGTRFHKTFTDRKLGWSCRNIDARDVEGTNLKLYEEWAEVYGEDSDFMRVRVRGQFPRAGSTNLISEDLVAAAVAREVTRVKEEPLILGVDCARFGGDSSVLAFRKGRDATVLPWQSYKNLDTMQLASRVVEAAKTHNVDMTFIDATGMGVGVYDRCAQLGLRCEAVNFSSLPQRFVPGKPLCKNRRAEMYSLCRDWLSGGKIPDVKELKEDLVQVQYFYDANNAIQLERKEDMKARGAESPDWADALVTTFASPVMPRGLDPNDSGPDEPYDPWHSLKT